MGMKNMSMNYYSVIWEISIKPGEVYGGNLSMAACNEDNAARKGRRAINRIAPRQLPIDRIKIIEISLPA